MMKMKRLPRQARQGSTVMPAQIWFLRKQFNEKSSTKLTTRASDLTSDLKFSIMLQTCIVTIKKSLQRWFIFVKMISFRKPHDIRLPLIQ
jgi:hypothetical protein